MATERIRPKRPDKNASTFEWFEYLVRLEEYSDHLEDRISAGDIDVAPLSVVEDRLIRRALHRFKGRTAEAAKALGMSQRKIQYRQKEIMAADAARRARSGERAVPEAVREIAAV